MASKHYVLTVTTLHFGRSGAALFEVPQTTRRCYAYGTSPRVALKRAGFSVPAAARVSAAQRIRLSYDKATGDETSISFRQVSQAEAAELFPPPVAVACGLGVDSVALLVGLHMRGLRPDLILFADAGAEKPETYAYIPVLQAWLKSVGFPELVVVKKRSKYTSLEDNCLQKKMLPSIAYGHHSCSDKYKQEPQRYFINNWQPARDAWQRGQKVIKLIGYDASPRDTERCANARTYVTRKGDTKYDYQYPLQDWQWSREDCVRHIRAAGLPVPVKSSCFFCTAMKESEIIDLRDHHPSLYLRAIGMEVNAKDNLRTVKGLGRSRSWVEVAGLPQLVQLTSGIKHAAA